MPEELTTTFCPKNLIPIPSYNNLYYGTPEKVNALDTKMDPKEREMVVWLPKNMQEVCQDARLLVKGLPDRVLLTKKGVINGVNLLIDRINKFPRDFRN